MKFALSLLAATAITAAAHAAPMNLLQNGSFEQFSGGTTSNGTTYGPSLAITGWNRTSAPAAGFGSTNPAIPYGPSIQTTPGTTAFGSNAPADNAASISVDAAGGHAAYFVDDQATETLSQTVTLVAGTRYSIGFDYAQVITGNPNPFSLAATFNGQAVTTATSANAVPAGQWFNATQDFIAASSGAYTFNFTYTSGAAPATDVLVDRVFVQAVPEPVSLALLGSGLIGTAMIRRRVRK